MAKLKITFFSDTHNKHGFHPLANYDHFLESDMAIFCGDMSGRGYKHEIMNFVEWYKKMPVKHKLFIAGNHDFFFEQHTKEEKEELLKDSGLIYLEDSNVVIEGLKIHGSPITPYFHNWSFNRFPEDIEKHWDLIPDDCDILVTHGPPFGFLDQVVNPYQFNKHVGCPILIKHIIERIKPKIHAFGHIHEQYGKIEKDKITFINASVLNENYELVNDPITVEL